MQIINPTTITDSMLVSSTVAENDYPEWSSSTSYSVGTKVMISATHKKYEALTANSNAPPASSPTDWLDLGNTNRWAMFDTIIGTQTTATESMAIELSAGLVTALALLNLNNVINANVVMTDSTDGEVYNSTIDMYDPLSIGTWYNYFFDAFHYRTSVIVDDLPSYRSATIAVTLTGGVDSTIAIGALVVGKLETFADAADQGSSFGITDYSRKEADAFGNYVIVERAFSKRADLSAIIDNIDLDRLSRLLASLRATPAVYIASNEFDTTLVFGYWRDFSTVISYPTKTELSIQLEGLI